MDYLNLGNTGLKVSRICLGCMTYGSPATGKLLPGRQPWALGEADSAPFFRQALDLGINFWDTANVYSGGDSEIVIGRFLKQNNIRRESMVIATKVCSPMREEPQAPPDRLHRPLPDPPLGLRNADRRNSGSTSRCSEGRKGPLHRRVVNVCMAVRQGPLYLAPQWMDPLRLHAEPLEPSLPRRRTRDDRPLQVGRHRRNSMESLGARPACAPVAERNHKARRDRFLRQQDRI